ncbi:MAG: hypothetical protein JWM98_3233 [Thermoleophilia bacterium]|nr:hypothetical protein [Thermoleophilia bacterium]
MNVPRDTLQHAFAATTGARDANARILQADRGPSWVRVLDAGRSSQGWSTELRSRADELAAAAPGDPGIAKANDYLRGAAWHATQGVDALRGAVVGALAGHEELQASALRLLDTTAKVDMYRDIATFESGVKGVDPALLTRVGEAGASARPSLERAGSDLDVARNWLRSIAQHEQAQEHADRQW